MRYFQSFCKAIGNYACYALCIIQLAREINETELDDIASIQKGIKAGYIDFNPADYDSVDNFYVRYPDRYLSMLTGKTFTVTREPATYKPRHGDYLVEFWSIDGKTGHFAMTYRGFNSLQKSKNVDNGKIISYRVFRRKI